MSNPPSGGRGTKGEASGLPMDDVHDALHSGDIGEARKARRSIPKPRSQARSRQAINDAQQGFSSLLNPQTDEKQPPVISKSGAIRSQKRGRIAGPSTEVSTGSTPTERSGPLLQSGTGANADERALSIEPAAPAWPSRKALSNPRLPGPIGTGASRAASTLSTAREQARLLIGDEDGNLGLGVDVHTANVQRRAASQWVTRYATHMVVLLIVGVLVALGGLKTMTVQGAFPRSLAAVNSFTGTDHIEDGDSANGKPDHDSPDYELTLPRTDLNGAVIPPAAQQPAANPAQPVSPAQAAEQRVLKLTQYVVVAGDTIDSIANKFNIMPETVMGSNDIFDSEEALAPGQQ